MRGTAFILIGFVALASFERVSLSDDTDPTPTPTPVPLPSYTSGPINISSTVINHQAFDATTPEAAQLFRIVNNCHYIANHSNDDDASLSSCESRAQTVIDSLKQLNHPQAGAIESAYDQLLPYISKNGKGYVNAMTALTTQLKSASSVEAGAAREPSLAALAQVQFNHEKSLNDVTLDVRKAFKAGKDAGWDWASFNAWSDAQRSVVAEIAKIRSDNYSYLTTLATSGNPKKVQLAYLIDDGDAKRMTHLNMMIYLRYKYLSDPSDANKKAMQEENNNYKAFAEARAKEIAALQSQIQADFLAPSPSPSASASSSPGAGGITGVPADSNILQPGQGVTPDDATTAQKVKTSGKSSSGTTSAKPEL